jgi:DNA mismatch endonuclease (patch repair protein)
MTTPATRKSMRANRRRDTGPELALRSAIYSLGGRYRVDHSVRVTQGRPIRPDIVFLRPKVAVFVDGCFWHACPVHGTKPAGNSEYWADKFLANRLRDARQRETLQSNGWCVLRFWEHADVFDAACFVLGIVASRSRAIDGIRANTKGTDASAAGTLATATALNEAIGYDLATTIVRKASDSGEPLRDIALAEGVDAELFDATIDLRRIARGNQG